MPADKKGAVFLRPIRRQLALPFLDNPCFSWQDFLADPSNAQARKWLCDDSIAMWPNRRLVIWGLRGLGKTHLLSAFAQRHDVAVVSGGQLALEHVIEIIEGEEQPVFVLDDAQDVADQKDLFHLINILAENKIPLLMSARTPPQYWDIDLPDLKSRLNSTMAIQLKKPDTDFFYRLMSQCLTHKDMTMPAKLISWTLRRLPHNAREITRYVTHLDDYVWGSNGVVDDEIAKISLRDFLHHS